MGLASRYWQLVRIDASGQRKVDTIESAQSFFQGRFAPLIQLGEVPDASVQNQLVHLMQCEAKSLPHQASMAQWCLRCFISSAIEQACKQLERQFGQHHGFSSTDLFPLVLTDCYSAAGTPSSSFQPLASQILNTFKPEQGSLITWTIKLVRRDRTLNTFLLDQGIYLVSDWAILNDTTPEQVERILGEFHSTTLYEIQQAMQLLKQYHAVYRQDRIQKRKTGLKGRCLEPTTAQLTQIAQQLHTTAAPTRILSQLQRLATQLRQYRIYARGGPAPTTSMDRPNEMGQLPQLAAPTTDSAEEEHQEFLLGYRELFCNSLDRAIDKILSGQLQRQSRKNEAFLKALYLFHCRGLAMAEIAPQINLKAQYQVSRLLKLKDLRADIRRQLLVDLRDRIFEQAQHYADPSRLKALDQQLDALLEEQVEAMIQEAATEASVPHNRPVRSLYARRMCQALDQRLQS